jgi:hypothetical protein
MEVNLHAFFTFVPDGDQLVSSCSGCFTPGERAPNIYWIRSSEGARILCGHGGEEKNCIQVVQPVSQLLY